MRRNGGHESRGEKIVVKKRKKKHQGDAKHNKKKGV